MSTRVQSMTQTRVAMRHSAVAALEVVDVAEADDEVAFGLVAPRCETVERERVRLATRAVAVGFDEDVPEEVHRAFVAAELRRGMFEEPVDAALVVAVVVGRVRVVAAPDEVVAPSLFFAPLLERVGVCRAIARA
jgi:hypothetical protein